MIVGTGLLARVFAPSLGGTAGIVVHAAGVSNSQCHDDREFRRERDALATTIREHRDAECLVYFSTCSVRDPASAESPYVRHKIAMEALVREHPRNLVLRLPQVVGRTPNPHTLLNYLHARISRGERFAVWRYARRNVIDCQDVQSLARAIIDDGIRQATLNIAAPRNHPMIEIVETMERAIGGHAVYDLLERGADYPIDVEAIRPYFARCDLAFGPDYLERVIRKYYVAT